MQDLSEKYYERLQEIAGAIQNSELLAQYMEEEEEDLYQQLRQQIEPHIAELHHEVAGESPLQLVSFEQLLLNDLFEGMYLPRVMGYAALRGEINQNYKYIRPNDHFKDILLAICKSVHFEQLKKRIGQCVSVGFALSSDIWITNLLAQIENKRIRYFLQQQYLPNSHDLKFRKGLYDRYAAQFKKELYYSADFPTTLGEMKANFSALRLFLLKRYEHGTDNSSLQPKVKAFLDNKEFFGTDEYLEMLCLYGNFNELTREEKGDFVMHFARERKGFPEFDEKYLRFQLSLYQSKMNLSAEHDERMSALVDKTVADKISDYYRIADKIHSLGYVHPDTVDAVSEFYNEREGLSVENECVRQVILNYFTRLISNLGEGEYGAYFDLTKIFSLYMKIFDNQQFNQAVEKISMLYIRKLLKKYTDKRGKDYQDIKRFVSTQFIEFEFLDSQEVVELFKTRRKRRKKGEEKPA
jgi:hypothetical protein